MAYSFASANSTFLSTGSTPAGAVPLTLAAWFNASAATGAIVSIGVATGSTFQRFQLVLSSQRVQAAVATTTGYGINTTTTCALNTWAHGCAVFANNSSRTAYLNAGGAATETTNATPTGLTSVAIGARYQAGFGSYFSGSLAEIGIWAAALSVVEIASLAAGVTCDNVRPQSLVFYAPLVRDLVDVRGGLAMTNNNSATASNHPRVYA